MTTGVQAYPRCERGRRGQTDRRSFFTPLAFVGRIGPVGPVWEGAGCSVSLPGRSSMYPLPSLHRSSPDLPLFCGHASDRLLAAEGVRTVTSAPFRAFCTTCGSQRVEPSNPSFSTQWARARGLANRLRFSNGLCRLRRKSLAFFWPQATGFSASSRRDASHVLTCGYSHMCLQLRGARALFVLFSRDSESTFRQMAAAFAKI